MKHPTTLCWDPEGDLMRLKIRFHSEVRRILCVHPLACCKGQGQPAMLRPYAHDVLLGPAVILFACTSCAGSPWRQGGGVGIHICFHSMYPCRSEMVFTPVVFPRCGVMGNEYE